MSWDISIKPANDRRMSTYGFYEDYACAPDESELLSMIENLLPSNFCVYEGIFETSIQNNSKVLATLENDQHRANTLARLYLQTVNWKNELVK